MQDQASANQHSLHGRIIRYLITGGLAFAAEYGSFLILWQALHSQLYVANSVSFLLGLVTSFLLNRSWAFRRQEFNKKVHQQFGLYLALAAFNLLMTNLLLGLLTSSGVKPWIGKVIVVALIAVWNFTLFNRFIFAESNQAKGR